MLHTELVAAPERDSRWLMVVLHGLGDSMEGYRWLPPELRLPSMNYLLVNAPDDYYGGFSWYDIYGEADPGVRRSRQALFELLDDLPRRGFAPERTFLFGFSQGCLIAIEAGARYPHRFAGLIGVSGYVHDLDSLLQELSPVARQQRFLLTHGTSDPLIPIGPVRLQVERLRAAGLTVRWREFPKVHTIAGEAELAVIRAFVREGMEQPQAGSGAGLASHPAGC